MEEKQIPARPYLESLTTFDLIKLADNAGIDIPPGLDRIFIIEELLDVHSREEEESFPEPEMMDIVFVESVPLPKQYNITFIEVMIRDPLWAFVFWELKTQEKEQFEKNEGFDGYYLKVSALQGENAVFTVPLGNEDTAWYLNFNPEMSAGQNRYKVELCAAINGRETIFAVSSPVKLPGLPELPSETDKKNLGGALSNPLIRLSGYGEFPVLRKNERASRSKRSDS